MLLPMLLLLLLLLQAGLHAVAAECTVDMKGGLGWVGLGWLGWLVGLCCVVLCCVVVLMFEKNKNYRKIRNQKKKKIRFVNLIRKTGQI